MKRNGKNGKHAHADAPALLEAAARSASIQLEQIEELFAALKLGRRQTSRRQVLRWFRRPRHVQSRQRAASASTTPPTWPGSIWVDCGHASICAAVAYWRATEIIRTERRSTPGGGELPPRAWIDWRAVVSRCGGRVSDRGAVRGGPSAAPAVAAGRPGPSRPPCLRWTRTTVPGAVPPGLASAVGDCNGGGEIHDATSGGPGPSSPPLGAKAEPVEFPPHLPPGALVQVARSWTETRPTPMGALVQVRSNPLHGGLVSMAVILAAARGLF